MWRYNFMVMLLLAFSASVGFTSCGDDDEEHTDVVNNNSGGGNSSGTDNTTSLNTQAARMLLGTWVDDAEYAERRIYVLQNNTSHAASLCQEGLLFSTSTTGQMLYGRQNDSFSLWKERENFTWRIISWENTSTGGKGKICITDGWYSGSVVYDVFYNQNSSLGVSGLTLIYDDIEEIKFFLRAAQ